jgi:hypothetical protein
LQTGPKPNFLAGQLDRGKMENDYFIDSTSYKQTYQPWKGAPAIKPAKENPKFVQMPLDAKSIYQMEFQDRRDE